MRKIIYFFSFLFFFHCSQNQKVLSQQYVTTTIPIVKMTRTACYGTCPQYEVLIYNNGFIQYTGKMFVDKIGCFYGYLSKDIIIDFISTLDAVNFFQMENEYISPITDIPSVVIEINISNKNHKVIDRLNGPVGLKKIQRLIDSIANSVLKWETCSKSD